MYEQIKHWVVGSRHEFNKQAKLVSTQKTSTK